MYSSRMMTKYLEENLFCLKVCINFETHTHTRSFILKSYRNRTTISDAIASKANEFIRVHNIQIQFQILFSDKLNKRSYLIYSC